jgi:putative polyhydroxyalkanoate system protein
LEVARDRAQNAAGDLAARFGATIAWKGNQLQFSRMGIKGHFEVRETDVEFYANLGFLGAPLKGKVETRAREILERYFGEKPPEPR